MNSFLFILKLFHFFLNGYEILAWFLFYYLEHNGHHGPWHKEIFKLRYNRNMTNMVILKQFTQKWKFCHFSPSCHSTPLKPLFIFTTHIKIFFIKPDGPVMPTLLARSFPFPMPRKVLKTYLKQFMWLQWFNLSVMKQWKYFLCAKKLNNDYSTVSRDGWHCFMKLQSFINLSVQIRAYQTAKVTWFQ